MAHEWLLSMLIARVIAETAPSVAYLPSSGLAHGCAIDSQEGCYSGFRGRERREEEAQDGLMARRYGYGCVGRGR